MGSYCELYIGRYHVDSFKGHVPSQLAIIFRDTDLVVSQVPYQDYYSDPPEDCDDDYATRYELVMSLNCAKDRLNLLGFTERAVRQQFLDGIEEALQEQNELRELREGVMDDYHESEFHTLQQLQQYGFDGWRRAISALIADCFVSNRSNITDEAYSKTLSPPYSVFFERRDTFLGFPVAEIGMFLRAVIEDIPSEINVILDITELIGGGYYLPDDHICSGTVEDALSETRQFDKILILTEGKSDSRIFERTLRILYPHLCEYFSFMDFGPSKTEGGAPALVSTIKSFAAAGINNKIVALFDNDAAGVEHWKYISSTRLPSNIKPLVLPYNRLASNYPTVGPQGEVEVDINGKAASTELYLGESVLRNANNQLIPVQWGSWNHKTLVYQGAISEKGEIQDRFDAAMDSIESKKTQASDFDFTGLRSIFEMIFTEVATM
ncbi:HEPN/Toprim-associated domain-containing protein [Dyadobacter sp. BHUBP1]|uniref:HEPN/Toprim-associated domain-containing protein n=1 Tax=Dyadobacter sp. BHUBP1 TaxID=3424178 RepID=UPI003D33A3A2